MNTLDLPQSPTADPAATATAAVTSAAAVTSTATPPAAAADAARPGRRRILVVSAGFDPDLNEMSTVWQRLADSRDVEVCVIALGTDLLEANRLGAGSRRFGRLTVHWLDRSFPLTAEPAVTALADAFRPDTIFTGPRDHLDCALDLAARSGADVALHVECFFDDRHWLRRREYFGLPLLRPFVGRRTRREVLARVGRVFVSDPRERARFGDEPRLQYLPWPHLPPAGGAEPALPQHARRTGELVYIGSLFRAKGVARLADYFCAAVRALPELTIRMIGPAVDLDGERALARIRAAAGERFSWSRSIPRAEALALVGRSFCVVSPGDSHGWGQIGDAWHLRTPVIAAREHYDLQAGRNCLIAADAEAFVAAVRLLRGDPALRERLAAGGADSVGAHDAARATDALAAGLRLTA